VTVEVGVRDEVGVTLAVAVRVGVAVAVGDGSLVGVAVGVRVGVGVAVLVGVAVALGPDRFFIRIRFGANTVVPPPCSSAVRSYWPGATAPMLNVVTEEAWVGWKESENTFDPFFFSTFSINKY
jgi:hypothetical protein